MDAEALDAVLRRSEELEAAFVEILEPQGSPYRPYDGSNRIIASITACEVSFEHGRALRLLIPTGLRPRRSACCACSTRR